MQLLSEVQSGTLHLWNDPVDMEQSVLKQRLVPKLLQLKDPSLVDVTHITYQAILEDLERLISLVLDPNEVDYAVCTGVLIHGPTPNSLCGPGSYTRWWRP